LLRDISPLSCYFALELDELTLFDEEDELDKLELDELELRDNELEELELEELE